MRALEVVHQRRGALGDARLQFVARLFEEQQPCQGFPFVLSGEVQAGILATPGMLPHVKAGKINALAVTSRQRSRLLPEVPTVAEVGFKDLQLEVLYVVFAPRQTPDAVLRTDRKSVV